MKPLGKYFGKFEPKELNKMDNTEGFVKFIIDTKTGIAFYVINPKKTYHITAASEHLGIKIDNMNTFNSGHIVGAIIQLSDCVYLVGKSSVETSEQHIKHTPKQLAIAEAVVKKIIKKFKLRKKLISAA